MDFYSCKTLAADTEYYMQLGSKKNIWKLQKLTLSQKIFSCKQYPAVEAENQRSEKCAKNIRVNNTRTGVEKEIKGKKKIKKTGLVQWKVEKETIGKA